MRSIVLMLLMLSPALGVTGVRADSLEVWRTDVPPRIYTPLDSKSCRVGEDPAMAASLTPNSEAPVVGGHRLETPAH